VTTTLKGVYVPADPQFPKHFHGLGMRIEDEVVVGAEHPIVLSANAPKEVCRLRENLALLCFFLVWLTAVLTD
jgi:Xaa-Pro aminopeptidase